MSALTPVTQLKEKPDSSAPGQDWRPGVTANDPVLDTSFRVGVEVRPVTNGSVEIVLTPTEGTKITTGRPNIDLKPLAELGKEALAKGDFDWGNALPPLIYSAGLAAGSMIASVAHNPALSIPLALLSAAGVFISFSRGSKWKFD